MAEFQQTERLIAVLDKISAALDTMNSTNVALNSTLGTMNSTNVALNLTLDTMNSTNVALKSTLDTMNSRLDTMHSTNVAVNSTLDRINARLGKDEVVVIEEKVHEPMYWRQHLDNIRQMRASSDAVDSMGASACADENASSSTRRFQILVALILSSETKNQTTAAAMQNLKTKGCNAQTLAKMPEVELAEAICPVEFFESKAVCIKRTARICVDKYGGDVPGTYDELCALSGVDPKIASLMMSLTWKKPVGVGVHIHMHRIAKRLGWTTGQFRALEKTEKALTRWMSKDLCEEVNDLFFGFGQQICTWNKPKCEDCLNQPICPYALRGADF